MAACNPFSAAAMLAAVCLLAPGAFIWGAERPIYRCELDGVLTFSDQPCDASAIPYEPDGARISTYAAPPAAKDEPASAAAAGGKRRVPRNSIAVMQRNHKEECARIRTGLREIRSKMRAGYSAAEGERLRTRERKLNERRRAARCP